MYILKIEEATYEIPTKLKELTIDGYVKIRTFKTEFAEYMSNQASEEGLTDDEKEFAEIERNDYFWKKYLVDCMNISEKEYLKLTDGDINSLAFDVLSDGGFYADKLYPLTEPLILDGQTLLFDQGLESMTMAQFVDLDTFTKDDETLMENLDKVLAILFRSKGKNNKIESYDSESVEERAEIFKEAKCGHIVNTVLDFFFRLQQIYETTTQKSSQNRLFQK